MDEKIIQQGAEAVLSRRGEEIVKRRVKKGYRFGELDMSIRRRRTRTEARMLKKVSKVISTPKILKVDEKKMEIEMEFISGVKLSEGLDDLEDWREVCFLIGENIAKLHDAGVVHGDLTTSNLILKDNEVYFIDFGLSFMSNRIEDKAVDLHLIKQALEAKHFGRFEEYFSAVLEGYGLSGKSAEVLKRLEKVELRGRYKAQF